MSEQTTPKGHLVAMGGGGFAMESGNTLMDDYVLSLANRSNPKICLVPTASADSPTLLVHFYRAFAGRAIATDLTIFPPTGLTRRPAKTDEIADFVADQDIIYVSGGNTLNLLSIWRAHGIDKVFHEAWLNGKIFCGLSAGMLCWFQGGVTDSFGDMDGLFDGLGWIDASACPHYDGEPKRRTIYHQLIRDGMQAGFAADDGAALHFQGTNLIQAVSSKPNAAAYRVEQINDSVDEVRLDTHFLG